MRLERLSPSQLVLYRANPCLWLGKYYMGWKDEAGPAAWRGSAVEAGLNVWLAGWVSGPSANNGPYDTARVRFELDAQGDVSEEVDKQRQLVNPMIDEAARACATLPLRPTTQMRCEHFLDGVNVPLLCFVDYDYPDFLFDLKTTERIPTEPRADHVLQCAIYSAARKKPARLLYVSAKKHQWFELTGEQVAEGLADARRAAQAIVALCEIFDLPTQAARTMCPNWDDFRWSDATKAKAMEIWA